MGNNEGQEPIPELNFDREPAIEWSEGVDEYKSKTFKDLWNMLGVPGQLPFFNEVTDPEGIHDPWNDKDKDWFKDKENTRPFGPRWHQLVGILKMLEQAFKGEPCLNIDEVGLGKTLQTAGLVSVLAFYREFFKTNHRFPGAFGE